MNRPPYGALCLFRKAPNMPNWAAGSNILVTIISLRADREYGKCRKEKYEAVRVVRSEAHKMIFPSLYRPKAQPLAGCMDNIHSANEVGGEVTTIVIWCSAELYRADTLHPLVSHPLEYDWVSRYSLVWSLTLYWNRLIKRFCISKVRCKIFHGTWSTRNSRMAGYNHT